jgi:hypothetical protein
MHDLTIVYYTANRIHESFATRVRQHLHQLVDGRAPIVSVSQKKINFGNNVCVGEIGYSAWVCYWQILIGARVAQTKFIACAEDDSLYTLEHLNFRPTTDAFYYNRGSRWILENVATPRPRFRWRDRTAMCGCIVSRDLLIKTLEARFAKFPEPITQTYDPLLKGWGEPGRYEKYLKLGRVGIEFFETGDPIITINHKKGLGGLRRPDRGDKIKTTLGPWGDAKELWEFYHG